MAEILTLTLNPAVDVAVSVERLIEARKLRCSAARRDPGGGGINAARVIHRLGGECEALYLAGGVAGQLLQEMLEAEGVNATCVAIGGETRENFSVRETSTGREFRFVLPGPLVSGMEWQTCIDHIDAIQPPPIYLVLSGSVPPGVPEDIYARIARLARNRGIHVVLDTSGPPLAAALEAGVFMVKPSLTELCELAGRTLVEETQWLGAAKQIIDERKAELVALSLGDRGALVVTAERALRVRALAVPVSSSIGAGDSFVGAMVWAFNRRLELDDALRYAMAAASATLLTEGTGLCELDEIERLRRQLADIVEIEPV